MLTISIIGAGAAGLSAAYTIAKAGHKPVVYESAPFLGGQASTFDIDGGRLEKGYHHLFTSDHDMINLIHELGLGSQLEWIESKVGIFCEGKIYNFITPLDLLRFTPLSILDRLRLGLVTMYLRQYKKWEFLENHTAAEWIRKYAGMGVYDTVWGPLLRGKFGSKYDKVGMPWFWGKIQTRFASRGKGIKGMQKEKLGYPIGSFAEIFESLDKKIHELGGTVNLSTGVKSISVRDGKAIGLEIANQSGPQKIIESDAVLATVPSYVFPKLVQSLPEDYIAKLNNVNYLSAVLIILELYHPFSEHYWLNIADRSIPFVGLIEQTNLVSPSIYGNKHVLYISNYLDESNPLFNMTDAELLETYIPHLKSINPSFNESWIHRWHYHKVAAAQPIIEPMYSERIPAHHTPIKNLYLANTTQIYPEDRGTNYSVRMGTQVAELMLNDLTR